jgi:hypothetical protein
MPDMDKRRTVQGLLEAFTEQTRQVHVRANPVTDIGRQQGYSLTTFDQPTAQGAVDLGVGVQADLPPFPGDTDRRGSHDGSEIGSRAG